MANFDVDFAAAGMRDGVIESRSFVILDFGCDLRIELEVCSSSRRDCYRRSGPSETS